MQRILIIEDDAGTALIYRSILAKRGYAVEVASDGRTGCERLLESPPDGLLLDLILPDGSGIELLKWVRGMERFQKLPVIVYTHGFVPHLIEPARAAGATEVFDKSILTPTMLVEAFQNALRVAA